MGGNREMPYENTGLASTYWRFDMTVRQRESLIAELLGAVAFTQVDLNYVVIEEVNRFENLPEKVREALMRAFVEGQGFSIAFYLKRRDHPVELAPRP